MKKVLILLTVLISMNGISQNDTIYPTDTLVDPSLFTSNYLLVAWEMDYCAVATSGSDTTFAPCYTVTYSDHYVTSIDLCPDNLDSVGGMGLHLGDPWILDANLFAQMELDGSNIINDTNNYWINYNNLTSGTQINGGGMSNYCIEADLFEGTSNTWFQSFEILLGPIDLPGPSSIPYSTAGTIGILQDGVLLEFTPPSSESTPAMNGGIIPIDYCGWHPEPAGFGHFHAVPTGINVPLNAMGVDTSVIRCTDVPQLNNSGLAGFTFEGIPIYGPFDDGQTTAPLDLDACYGHTGVTPEFPGGVYHYHVSSTEVINSPPCRGNYVPLSSWEYGEWTGSTSVPSTPGTITGLASVCENQSGLIYSIADVTGATTYNWTVPSGATITSGTGTTSITVDFGTTSGNVCVNAENSFGASADNCTAITISACGSAPSTPGVINGLSAICENQTGVNYSIADVTGATTYNWTVPSGATIISGTGTTSITVDFGTTSGNVCVNAENSFGSSTDNCTAITVSVCGSAPATPGTITGLSSLCENQPNVAYSISAVASATTYNWTVPAGATIISGTGTTSITVDFGTTSGNICVNAENSFGSSTDNCTAITVNACGSAPMMPPPPMGLATVCENQTTVTYTTMDVMGATTYNWTVPNGATITSGTGTTSITVDFGTTSGNVCVNAENSFGTSADNCTAITVNVCGTIPSTPGTITGLTTVCENQTTVTYSIDAVTGADTYNWTVPTGATIVSGNGTVSIVVDFGTTSGDVCVNAENSAGTTTDVCETITVQVCGSAPTAPMPPMGLDTVCANQNGVTYNVPPVMGADTYNWTVPAGATIASGSGTNSITVSFGSVAGDVCVSAENAFGTSSATCISVSLCDDTGIELQEKPDLIKVYPNPVDGNTLTIEGNYDSFEMYTIEGALVVKSKKANNTLLTVIDVSAFPAGIYFLNAQKGNEMVFKKIVLK